MDNSKLSPEFVKWFDNLSSSKNLTSWQKSHIKERIEQKLSKCPDKDVDPIASRSFQKALSKIQFNQTKDGGIYANFDALNREELFAIGETDTDAWPIGAPESVREAKKVVAQNLLKQGLFGAINSMQNDLRESMRKKILDLSPGQMAIAASIKQSKMAKMPRPKTKPTRRSIVIQAMETSRKNYETLETFIESAIKETFDEFCIKKQKKLGGNEYIYEVDCNTPISGKNKFSRRALEDWWDEAGKNSTAD